MHYILFNLYVILVKVKKIKDFVLLLRSW